MRETDLYAREENLDTINTGDGLSEIRDLVRETKGCAAVLHLGMQGPDPCLQATKGRVRGAPGRPEYRLATPACSRQGRIDDTIFCAFFFIWS